MYFRQMNTKEKMQIPLTFFKKKLRIALAHLVPDWINEHYMFEIEQQIFQFVYKKINLYQERKKESIEKQKKEIEDKCIGKKLCPACGKLLALYDFDMEGGDRKVNCWRHSIGGEIE